MNDINKYASRFNYKVADVIEAIKSKYYKNNMDLDDAVEEVLDNMVAMKTNLKDELSEKDSKELGIRDMIAFTQQRIRNLINDEYEAIDGYTSAISEFMRNYKETNDELYNQLAMVLTDIKKEEFPHVGELNKCLSLIDEEEGKLFNKGVREAKKTVEKSMAPQEQEQVEE